MLGAHCDFTSSTGKIHESKLFVSPYPIPCHSPNLPSPSSWTLGLVGPLPILPLTQMEIRETARPINPHTPVHTCAQTHSSCTLTPPQLPPSTHKISWDFTSFELKKTKLWLPATAFLVSENQCVLLRLELAGDPGGEEPACPGLITVLMFTHTGQR